MKALVRQMLHLVIDSPGLALATLGSTLLSAVARGLGLGPRWAGLLLVVSLGATLAASVRRTITTP